MTGHWPCCRSTMGSGRRPPPWCWSASSGPCWSPSPTRSSSSSARAAPSDPAATTRASRSPTSSSQVSHHTGFKVAYEFVSGQPVTVRPLVYTFCFIHFTKKQCSQSQYMNKLSASIILIGDSHIGKKHRWTFWRRT